MNSEWKILTGFILDLLLGDPYFFPHPVRGIGLLITWLEKGLHRLKNERIAGILLVIITVAAVYGTAWLLCSLSVIIEVFLIYTVFAVNCLAREAWKIYRALAADDPEKARSCLSFLVSRETAALDRQGIIRAAVETVAENIVDGVIAPLFFLSLGGLPLAYAYKAVNTLDSMVGYKNEKYLNFGRAAARLDDYANWLPARLTGFLLMPLAALCCGFDAAGSLRIVKRDRLKHASPNSGHGEAAAAGALHIRLGGNSVYFGKVVEKPLIGDCTRELVPADIKNSIVLLMATSLLGVGGSFALLTLIPG